MVDDLSTEALIERLQEESRSCTYPTDAAGVKKRYKDIALILFKEDLDDGTLRNYLTFGTRRSSSVSQYGNTPVVIRRSRSSNGELTTVIEQVPALHGRSSRSNYTLLEAGEKETDSDDETNYQESRFNSDESFAIKENNDQDTKWTVDSIESIQRDQKVQAASNINSQSATYPQESSSTISEQQNQDHDNKKSFSHHDSSGHRCKESAEGDTDQVLEESRILDNKRISKESEEITTEVLDVSALDKNKQVTTEVHKDNISINLKDNLKHQVPDDVHSQSTSKEKDPCQTFLPTTTDRIQNRRSIPEIDHEAILRRYVEQPSRRSKSLPQDKRKAILFPSKISKKEEPNESLKHVELKIVESTDSIYEQANLDSDAPDTQKTLTTSDIPHLSDESDVVFIDAGSPSLSRTKLSRKSSVESNEEVVQDNGRGEPSADVAVDAPDKHNTAPQSSEPVAASKNSEVCKEEVATRRRHSSHNSFRDLPIRSPTPPRRKPQKSPQTPKLREKTRYRHSSLALTSEERTQELLTNGTRSASPTPKAGDFRFFSFSLKKEKSKSATSLGSKRNRERVRLTSVKLSLEDPGTVNPKLVPSQREDSQVDNSEKRVGVRSMMIDGTIKRNFIVIHPSDDSDTIGLAPMSHHTPQKDVTPPCTPEALSTVKTRITSPSMEKFEVMKRISCQGGLKEELSDIPENLRDESKGSSRGSFSVSQLSKSLKIKQNKKNFEHLPLKTSYSLSGEPVYPSPSNSQILYKSPPPLSRVDCDSPTVPAQVVPAEDSRIVSKLCVVM